MFDYYYIIIVFVIHYYLSKKRQGQPLNAVFLFDSKQCMYLT